MRKKNLWQGKGFYITVGLFVFAAVAGSALAIRSMVTKLETQNPTSEVTSWADSTQPAEKPQSSVPVLPAQPSPSPAASRPSASSATSAAASVGSAGGTAARSSGFGLPVSGRVTAAYSGDELVYDRTMDDWRTHNGLDITAAAGTQVTAAMAGTVTKLTEDAQWGTVVEVTGDKFTLRYCGLAANAAVGEGALVKQGDLLGTLGEIPAESALEPHLHFEVLQDGRLVDPEILMG